LRPEIGFTPKWYRDALGIDFGERWHRDPDIRQESLLRMKAELNRRFPGIPIGQYAAHPDWLTGAFGACTVAGIYGIPIVFSPAGWPNCARTYLADAEAEKLEPPELESNPFFNDLMAQVEVIASREKHVFGFINWQGVLNNAQRLRGEKLFYDMIDRPELALHIFECVTQTMIAAARRLHRRQAESGVAVQFFTVSNCLVNMLSPEHYVEFLLPFDQQISWEFGCIGIHNCAWTADPYLDAYAQVPNVRYIDMGISSDLRRARELFPQARRALMFTPMDLKNKSLAEIRLDMQHIAEVYGPCDVVAADIESGTPDSRVIELVRVCEDISAAMT